MRSKTLMQGYYRDPDATGEAIAQGWLRTRDLGYVSDGELFVTGRIKEIIIKGGRNLIPSAIEEIASSVPGVRGCRERPCFDRRGAVDRIFAEEIARLIKWLPFAVVVVMS